jgi:hypothetical protein
MAPAVATYEPRDPSRTVLYTVIANHLETFLASLEADPDAPGLPAYVEREFYDYLQCGILAHGFLRMGCDTCKKEMLLPFSCKRRGFCPSCAGRRMAQTAAHLVEQVIPWVPTRQWVVSVPIPLRYWMASSRDLMAQVHTIGDGHVSLLPTWFTPDHCRHHPGVGDHAHLAASPAGVRSTSHCPCPWSPSTLRVRLSPRPVASSHRRRAC